MNTIETVVKTGERKTRKMEDDFLYNRFAMLQWEYFFSFTVGGLLLLSYFGYLSWTCGIAWVFISNIIAIILIRIDVSINVGRLLECEKRKFDSIIGISSLN